MSIITRKRNVEAGTQALATTAQIPSKGDKPVLVVEWCQCGNIITARARNLQGAYPSDEKMCFNCLIHQRRVVTSKRNKDGWSA